MDTSNKCLQVLFLHGEAGIVAMPHILSEIKLVYITVNEVAEPSIVLVKLKCSCMQ